VTLRAHLGGHPNRSITLPMPSNWTEPPPVIYAHKFGEAGAVLRDFEGVIGVPFRLVTKDDGAPVILPDGSVEYWHEPGLISGSPTA
jgi:hypothetical protein